MAGAIGAGKLRPVSEQIHHRFAPVLADFGKRPA
jgi:hypothetical protein